MSELLTADRIEVLQGPAAALVISGDQKYVSKVVTSQQGDTIRIDIEGERVSVQELACSLRPPKGWASVKKGDAFHVQAAEETDGFRPCLNVVSVPRNATTGGNYVSWVKEEDSKALQDFELISEGPTKLGSLQAVEIVCRGTRNERTATVRQLVVENENRVWIVSAFTPAEGADAVAGALAESLKSFEVSGTK